MCLYKVQMSLSCFSVQFNINKQDCKIVLKKIAVQFSMSIKLGDLGFVNKWSM